MVGSGPISNLSETIFVTIVVLVTCKSEEGPVNQRTNGPVNPHLISWPSKSTEHTNPKQKWLSKPLP